MRVSPGRNHSHAANAQVLVAKYARVRAVPRDRSSPLRRFHHACSKSWEGDIDATSPAATPENAPPARTRESNPPGVGRDRQPIGLAGAPAHEAGAEVDGDDARGEVRRRISFEPSSRPCSEDVRARARWIIALARSATRGRRARHGGSARAATGRRQPAHLRPSATTAPVRSYPR
jgi:hypothetical protein